MTERMCLYFVSKSVGSGGPDAAKMAKKAADCRKIVRESVQKEQVHGDHNRHQHICGHFGEKGGRLP